MRVVMGGDHAGYEYKEQLRTLLMEEGIEVDDLGPFTNESCDYPDFAHAVAKSVDAGKADFGVLICGSANGVAMVANKYQKVRAAICWNEEVTELARKHNDANIICLPARFISLEAATHFVHLFLQTEFEGGRHERRVAKIPR
ncbi:MAG: ribose 5-phosphate isomerase B [Chitinophagales bacterium]